MPPLADILIIGVLLGFAYFGWKSGLIQSFGSVVGTIVGVYVAGRFYEPLAGWLIAFTHWNPNFVRVVVFVLVFIISNRLVGVVFWIINKIFGVIARLPILAGLDRLLGVGFGLIEGVIVLGVALFFITKFPPSPEFIARLAEAKLAPRITEFTSFLWPLLPKELTDMVGRFDPGDIQENWKKLPDSFKLRFDPATSTGFKLP